MYINMHTYKESRPPSKTTSPTLAKIKGLRSILFSVTSLNILCSKRHPFQDPTPCRQLNYTNSKGNQIFTKGHMYIVSGVISIPYSTSVSILSWGVGGGGGGGRLLTCSAVSCSVEGRAIDIALGQCFIPTSSH